MNLATTFSKKLYAFLFISMLCLTSAPTLRAAEVTPPTKTSVNWIDLCTGKNTLLVGVLLTIIRLTLKEKPTPVKNRITYANICEKLATKKTVQAKLSFLIQALDDILFGYAGKASGVSVSGKELKVSGKMTKDTNNNDIEKSDNEITLEFHKYESIPAYGLAGTTWSLVKTCSKGLGDIKEITAVASIIVTAILAKNFAETGKAFNAKA